MYRSHVSTTLTLLKELATLSPKIWVDGHSLSIPKIYAVVNRTKSFSFVIPDSSIKEMEASQEFLAKKLREGAVVYGTNTGFGGSADVRSNDLPRVQKSLLRTLNAGFGEKLPRGLVRAVMLDRANSLSRAYSGVRPRVAHMLLEMLERDIIPQVPKRGSVSASGDLVPTSYIAAAMMGRQDINVWFKGQDKPAREALREAAMEPIAFQAKEALAVINSSSFAACLAATLLLDINCAALLTQAATAMSVESMCGHSESFHPTIHECMHHPGQQEVAINVGSLLKESSFTHHVLGAVREDDPNALKQDRYPLRTSPQWLGPVVETLVESVRRIHVELNSVNDNPLIDHRKGDILSCGNFQGTSITVAMDQTRQAVQLCGKLLFAQMSEFVNWHFSRGLPPNLSGCDISNDFGFKGVDIAMASYMSELDYLTNPITNHVLSAEMHNQGVNSLALISARLTQEALEILQMMLSCILCAHLQAIDLRWLQKKVEEQLEELYLKYHIDHRLIRHVTWYRVAFTPRETGGDILLSAATDRTTEAHFIDDLETRMDNLLRCLINGEQVEEVTGALGEGTAKLYHFLRGSIGIPFNHGDHPLDKSLEKIFQAIKDRSMDQVLIDMFDPEACDLRPESWITT